ncbi:hypothetical protein [Lacipirellula sp.]|uniref:hypothetical protein n=1 Tax=Lacipirellula sp. TaxID=2691419 RepID=UPI003D0B55BF
MHYQGLLESPYPHISPRKFAELPFSRSWQDMFSQLEQLDGCQIVRFTGEDRDTWIVFDYRGFEFGMHDRGAIIEFTVSNYDCPEDLLSGVLHHFSEFLSPSMSD